jgi:LBP / BPI / CETP family, C-terminal domain
LFIGLFKKTIINSIASGINLNVPKQLSATIQSLLIASNGVLPLPYGLAFDFQMPADPIVTSETIGLYLNATFFNSSRGYKVPYATPINDMHLNFTSKNLITFDTSRYTIDSILLTL